MTVVSELVIAVQGLAAAVADTAVDPADRIRLMVAMASIEPVPGGSKVFEALGRRAALAVLARAGADLVPRSYDEAQRIRDLVCGLLDAEELRAADAFEDEVAAALRELSGAVYRDLTRRGGSLSPLRQYDLNASLPSVVLAHRLYGDATREAELTQAAGDPPNPLQMPQRFRALAR